MSYGVPYKGSKNSIAEQIVAILPPASTLYDVFAGGCAITHCALLQQRYQHYVMVDSTDIPQVFLKAWQGEPIPSKWVSRGEYMLNYEHDPLLKVMWSFSNKPGHYIYSTELEPFKYAIHSMAVDGQFFAMYMLLPDACEYVWHAICRIPLADIKTRRLAIGSALRDCYEAGKIPAGCPLVRGERGLDKRSTAVENLERLSRLQSIYSKDTCGKASLEFKQMDYREVMFSDPAGVIYCDPPYRDTDGYGARNSLDNFDFNAFYDWCEKQTLPVYISEYDMPSDRFECVAAFDKTSTCCATKTLHVVEKLWRPRCLPKELYGNLRQP